jgi:cytochrome c553
MVGLAFAAQVATAGELTQKQLARVHEIVDDACSFCHGEKGEASNPIYPRLAAQNREYLARQLRLFRSGARKSDIMNEQAADLSDEDIEALATYFAGQPPRAHKLPDTEQEKLLWQVGRYVFRFGDAYQNIPPCMTCHGKDARGGKTLPRLAGQHRKYIVNQLLAFQSGKRKTDDAIMRSIAKNLSRLEMEAVGLYLSTLKPEAAGKGGAR